MTKARDTANLVATGVPNSLITLDAAEIPNISTDKLTSGTLPDARIADLSATKLTGSIADARIPASAVTQHVSDYIAWQSVQTTNFTAVAGRGYPINTNGGAITVTLPASASAGDTIKFVDYFRTFGTNALTLNPNSLKFQGNATPNPVYDTDGQGITLTYIDATQGWLPTTDDDVTLETPQTYGLEYLVVAGGGAGGEATTSAGYGRGGGGAGGYLTNYGGTALQLTPSSVYTITVGDGGAVVTDNRGANGENSSIVGSDITDVISIGGGGGGGKQGSPEYDGSDGGSGGGAGYNGGTGGSATAGQGNAGGSSNNNTGAGGGGAGAVGVNNSSYDGGDGGIGLSNSITGAAVFYAGGGGGGGNVQGTGGNGGGGNGGRDVATTIAATAGTANTGGGGGGGLYSSSPNANAAAGGSGVVILRVATSDYTGPTSGSPTITTDGSDTIMKFTASGSYTA